MGRAGTGRGWGRARTEGRCDVLGKIDESCWARKEMVVLRQEGDGDLLGQGGDKDVLGQEGVGHVLG